MARKQKKVFRLLAGVVRTEDGIRRIRRGDELPDNTLPEERKRYEEKGWIGEPWTPPATVTDADVERIRTEQAAQAAAAGQVFGADQEAAQEVVDGTATPGAAEASRPTVINADSSDEDLDSFVAEANVDDTVAAAGDNPALAARLLDAEKSVRGSDARSTVIAPLEKLAADDGDE